MEREAQKNQKIGEIRKYQTQIQRGNVEKLKNYIDEQEKNNLATSVRNGTDIIAYTPEGLLLIPKERGCPGYTEEIIKVHTSDTGGVVSKLKKDANIRLGAFIEYP